MSNQILRIHVEKPGTLYTAENGDVTSSVAGHIWLETISAEGKSTQMGFAPTDPKSTITSVTGTVYDNDDAAYSGNPYFTASYEITGRQAEILKAYQKNPSHHGFDESMYSAHANSCVDFAFKGLELIGMNPTGNEGKLLPMDNIKDLSNLRNPDMALGTVPVIRLENLIRNPWNPDGAPGIPGGKAFFGPEILDGTVTVGPLGAPPPQGNTDQSNSILQATLIWDARFSWGSADNFNMGAFSARSFSFPMFTVPALRMNNSSPYSCGRNYVRDEGW